jgi:endonuclease YncB( thermonuclease family)
VWRICNGVKNCSAHYTFIAILLLGLIAIGLAAGVHASDDGRVRAELIYVIDGDTFRAHVEGVRSPDWLSASDRLGHRIRVAEIDTPELKGKCEREKQLAILAKDAAAALLKAGRTIELTDLRPDKYGRIVASVWIDGQNLGAELLRQGLARAFYVWPRREWCLNGD